MHSAGRRAARRSTKAPVSQVWGQGVLTVSRGTSVPPAVCLSTQAHPPGRQSGLPYNVAAGFQEHESRAPDRLQS